MQVGRGFFGALFLGAVISGGGAVVSGNMPDPYTPVDGTMNVTGAFAASTTVTAGTDFVSGASGAFRAPTANTTTVGGGGSTAAVHVVGGVADGASAVAARIAANADYTTAGAKIASFGDSAGSSYAEKAAFMLDGAMLHTPTALALSGAHTALPVGGIVQVTCTGAQTWAPTETGATNGEIHHIVNVGSDALTMDHVAGQVLLNGAADVVLGQNDAMTIYYSTAASAWIQLGATSNN